MRSMSVNQQKEQEKFMNKFNKVKPAPPIIRNICAAFLVGGLICAVGQFFQNQFLEYGLPKNEAGAATSIVMVFLGSFFTGLGVYDELGKYAGAGSVVPITGFANSIVAPAMEFKREGYVFGIGAKMFIIAGPVIVYGIVTAVLMGTVHWFSNRGV
jgi:stage V sporulation protein AC